MKTSVKFVSALLFFLVFILSSCEPIPDFTKETDPPIITSLFPQNGQAGDDITIVGENLQFVDTVYVGSGVAKVKYKLSANNMVITLTTDSRSGKIRLTGKGGSAVSVSDFNVHFATPSLSEVPTSGKVKEEIEIIGENMDAVTRVIIGEKVAPILIQKRGDMIVKVPFDESAQAPIRFEYFDGMQTQSVLSNHAFEVITEIPAIYDTPTSGVVGLSYEITGKNLINVDRVVIGEWDARIVKQSNNALTFNMPSRYFQSQGSYAAKIIYYETEQREMTSSFFVLLPNSSDAWHRWDDVCISGHTGNQSFVDAETGSVYSNCEFYADNRFIKEVDFMAYVTTAGLFAFYGKHQSSSILKNYKCDNKSITELNDTLLGAVVKDEVKFRVLDASNTDQNDLIVKAHTHTLSVDDINIAMSVTAPASSSPNSSTWTVGSVLLVSNATTGKRGLICIKEIIGLPDLGGRSTVLADIYWMK